MGRFSAMGVRSTTEHKQIRFQQETVILFSLPRSLNRLFQMNKAQQAGRQAKEQQRRQQVRTPCAIVLTTNPVSGRRGTKPNCAKSGTVNGNRLRRSAQKHEEMSRKVLCLPSATRSVPSLALNGVTEFDTNQVFETVDVNRDGNLTRAEVIKGLRRSADVSQRGCARCC